MAYILCIETSTTVCSAALTYDGVVLSGRREDEGNSHATRLTVLIQQLFDDPVVDISISDIDAVAVSSGPGSYTGLRIGVSTAKGLCFALDKPLIALPSLLVLAWPVVTEKSQMESETGSWFCPMIDARRMEVYTAFFDGNMRQQRRTTADIVEANSFRDILESRKVWFFGNGALKCRTEIDHPNAHFLPHRVPLAQNMAAPAFEAWQKGDFENVAYFEPFYLKDFVASLPRNKIINPGRPSHETKKAR